MDAVIQQQRLAMIEAAHEAWAKETTRAEVVTPDQTGLPPRELARIKAIIAKHADGAIAECGRGLLNFDIPAQRTINYACAQMGIKRIDWEKIEAVRGNFKFVAPPTAILRRWERY